ncbi:lipopolysaccharide biosynthesis protein [Massilia niastensis]|uniref:lipopolysaccharide biosynthesis protein n=1 Tax=Massilia niastensis TaxID=544911 RepID=UPI00037A892E|nr:lipopolysaccharide biosynthesis protein [Massilia niastensis]
MTDSPPGNINRQIAKGAAWMVAFRMLDRSIGLISTVILARMLSPEDFGLVGIAMILISALSLLVSFGFDTQLVQNAKAGRDHFDTAWTFSVIFSVGCGLVLAALAYPASQFYREPRLEAVVYVLALGFALEGFSNIGTVAFRREMRFDREFKFLLSKRFASLLVTIPLAIYLRNYWALVIGQLAGIVLSLVLSYVVSSYRPRFSLKTKLEMFHTSKWLVVNSFFQFIHNRAASFTIARVAGAQWVGVYSIASEIANLPSNELVAPINRAAFPGYSRVAHNLPELRNSFLKVIASIALISIPSGVGIVVVADLLVPAALGWKWLAAIPLIQILAVYGVIKAVQTNISYIYLALGQVKRITLVWCVQIAIMLVVLIPASIEWGVMGAAWSYLATAVLMIPMNQSLVAKCLDLNATTFCRELVRPLLASSAMAMVVLAVKSQLVLRNETLDYVLALLLCSAVGALVYTVAIYALWRLSPRRDDGLERHVFLKIQALLGRAGIRVNLLG